MENNLKVKLEELVIYILKNIKRYPNIIQRLKFYEQIHLGLTLNKIKNKREIYYNSVSIFKKQSIVDMLIKDTCNKLKCTQSDLLISTTLKGVFYGNITFYKNNKLVHVNLKGTSLIPDMNQIDRIEYTQKKCLIIEKDTIFSKIVREYTSNDILFICGKGYPCRNTILLVNKLNIRKYGIFDFDPYGLEICTKYPSIKKIGIDIKDINLIDKQHFMILNKYDIRKINTLLKQKVYEVELFYMLKNNIKIEIEGLFSAKGFDINNYFYTKII